MDDHEKHSDGVSWGREMVPTTLDATNQERLKNTKRYSSFRLKDILYRVHDTVYLRAPDGPPYIAKIVTMYENFIKKEKCMCVRLFCKISEIPARVAGVNTNGDSKEVFMSWNSGSKIVVDPAFTLGKCNVLCTTPLPWNDPPPTPALIAAADHVFSYAFDTKALRVTSLNVVVKQFGENYVKGLRTRIPKVRKSNGGSPRKAVEPGSELEARVIYSDQRDPVRVVGPNVPREAVEPGVRLEARVIDSNQRDPARMGGPNVPRKAVDLSINFEARVIDSNKRDPARVGGPNVLAAGEQSMAELIAKAKMKRPTVGSLAPRSEPGVINRLRVTDSLGPDSEPGIFKRPRVTESFGPSSEPGILQQNKLTNSSSNGLSDRPTNVPSVYTSSGANTLKVAGMKFLDNEVKGKQMPDPGVYKANGPKRLKVGGMEYVDNELKGRQIQDPGATPYPPVQNFIKLPFHKALEMALEKGRALLLQNLDPWFSSSEIEVQNQENAGNNFYFNYVALLEAMLTELLRFSCDARMLPPKDFSSFTSGDALVLFRSQVERDNALGKFTENVLIWSQDERPVVASIACKDTHEINRFLGFLDLDQYRPRTAEAMQKGKEGATSHCSQPNTVVFEMGMQWRLLQERHREAWNLAAQECKVSSKVDPTKINF